MVKTEHRIARKCLSLSFSHRILVCSVILFNSCIHPQVGIRKAYLLDPTMDPAQSSDFSETLSGSVQSTYEKAIVSGGGASGGSCPTCK
jgi:hypothetical protein